MKEKLVTRLRNPAFLLALAGLIYQILESFGIQIPKETYREAVDVISYVFIGVGVYSSFDSTTTESTEK